MPTTEWFHYGALDRKNHVCKIFLNGDLLLLNKDNYSSFNNNEFDLTIGTCNYTKVSSGISNLKGTIDDLRLYNVALDSYDYEQIINGPVENTESPFVVSIELPAVMNLVQVLRGQLLLKMILREFLKTQLLSQAMRKIPPR